MQNDNTKCRCCNTVLLPILNTYTLCNNCFSYNFFSENDKNAEYFNDDEIIFLNDNAKEDKAKISVFSKFENYINISKNDEKWQSKIYSIIQKNKKILEIGIGNGLHLYRLLEKGIDIYGTDIADSLISNFKTKYPKYADRVFNVNNFYQNVDVVYNSAVFEHIPNPKEFLSNIYNILNDKGLLILDNFPVIPKKKYKYCYEIENDISFWKYIHLIIYSEIGLEELFRISNFKILEKSIHDCYRYKVFSQHLTQNYRIVEKLRNFFWDYNGLPNIKDFTLICIKALFKHSKAFLGSYILQKI